MKPLSIAALCSALLLGLFVVVFTLENKSGKPYSAETTPQEEPYFSGREQSVRAENSFDVLFALTFIRNWLGVDGAQEEEEEITQPSPFRAVFGVYLLIKN